MRQSGHGFYVTGVFETSVEVHGFPTLRAALDWLLDQGEVPFEWFDDGTWKDGPAGGMTRGEAIGRLSGQLSAGYCTVGGTSWMVGRSSVTEH